MLAIVQPIDEQRARILSRHHSLLSAARAWLRAQTGNLLVLISRKNAANDEISMSDCTPLLNQCSGPSTSKP
jgi:hypothetical protein